MKRFKISNPDQDDDASSGCNTAKETIKFFSMAPLEEETLSAFHGRLVNQAAVCGFQCGDCRGSYKQRLIRDRLLQVLDEYTRSKMFQRFEDPTIEDILTECQEEQDFQNKPGWNHILSFLELVELETFAKSHPRFRKLVNTYLEKGGRLVIKRRSWNRYKDTPEVFIEYGQRTTALELAKIEMNDIFLHFPRVKDVTMREVVDQYAEEQILPGLLRSLTIIGEFKFNQVEDMMQKSKHSLEHLQLTRIVDFQGTSHLGFTFTKLKSLTLVNHILRTNVPGQPLSPVLEEYNVKILAYTIEYDLPWSQTIGALITSLTLDHADKRQEIAQYEMMKSLANLKHLRILKAISPEYKDRIDELNLESVDVHYLDVHYLDVPEDQDLMVNMLDDDCLHLIMDFLDAPAVACLCQVHSRFRKVALARPKMICAIGSSVLQIFPVMENRVFYYWLGRIVNELSVATNEEETFYQVVGHFKKLEKLSIGSVRFYDDKRLSNGFPTKLRCLTLSSVFICDPIAKATVSGLFRRMNPTLVKLGLVGIYGGPLLEGLSELTNVRDLGLDRVDMNPALIRFLTNNQAHLERLNISDYESLEPFVREMKKLQCLKVLGNFLFPPSCSLYELEELHLICLESGLDRTLMGLEAPKLKHLELDVGDYLEHFGRAIKDSMPQVESLNITTGILPETLAEQIMLGAVRLKTLEVRFDLDEFEKCDPFKDHQILAIVKGLSQLTSLKINMPCESIDWDVMRELRAHLQENNRQLRMNGVIYP